jgi:hypothetical protein
MTDRPNSHFIKTDDSKVINERYIRWIKKIDECLEVCTKHDGCHPGQGTHRICKINNGDSYKLLNRYFKEPNT